MIGRERVYQVELPLPPKEASPNDRSHWAKKRGKNGAVSLYRQTCAWLYRDAQIPQLKNATIDLDYYLGPDLWGISYRPRDEQNGRAAFKAAQDALVDAGVIPGDSARYVHDGYTRIHSRKKDHQGRCCVVVTITEE